MSYKIKRNQIKAAKDIGVTIKPSEVKGKKIAVFKNGEKVADIGAIGYSDFWTYYAADPFVEITTGRATKENRIK